MKFGRVMPMQRAASAPATRPVTENDTEAQIVAPSISPSSEETIKPSTEESHASITFSDMPIPAAEKPAIIKEEEEEKPIPSSPAAEVEQDKGDVKSSILLVDHSPVTLEFNRHILDVSGHFTIDTAETAIKALEMLQQKRYYLVITDQEMPEQTGQEFIKTIRQHPSLNSVGTILLTGNLNEMLALEGGADGYISKPTDPELLVARAKSISDIYRRLSGVAPVQSTITTASNIPVKSDNKTGKVEFTAADMDKISDFELDKTMNSALLSRQIGAEKNE
jgi:two-component system chemotaxis response regulator CheY